jgi:hypothetical protein
LILLVAAVAGCSVTRGKPFDPSLVGQKRHLCCNLRFSTDGRASDANYARYGWRGVYEVGPLLAAGTRVEIVNLGSNGAEFQTEDHLQTYFLLFHYGKEQMSAKQYFSNILTETSPLEALTTAPPSIAEAMRKGELLKTMTKQQVLFARGYPPAHRTPALDADEWIFYDTPGFVDRVAFENGKVKSITRGPAPE